MTYLSRSVDNWVSAAPDPEHAKRRLQQFARGRLDALEQQLFGTRSQPHTRHGVDPALDEAYARGYKGEAL